VNENLNRSTLFISHANPEDNEFARWLSLRLARDGYKVWCDLTQLIGGEVFWMDVEEAIREHSIKFVFVLSQFSNKKEGTRKELAIAETTSKRIADRDYIIPIRIDDIQHDDMNIEIHRRNAIDFHSSWAEGYTLLLKKLEHESVRKVFPQGPESVSEWWRNQYNAEAGLRPTQEEHYSNWFPIDSLPTHIFRHRVRLPDEWISSPYSMVQHERYQYSFAALGDLGLLKSTHTKSTKFLLDDFLREKNGMQYFSRHEARRVVVQLLNDAWTRFLVSTQLPTYQFSESGKAVYFPCGRLEGDRIFFSGVAGKTYRQVCGVAKESFWHFAIRGRSILSPFPAIEIKSHVLFSDDGTTIWESKERLHRKRRSHCRSWWNDEWRDRLLATMSWFSEVRAGIIIPVSSSKSIEVSSKPMSFFSNVAYSDPTGFDPSSPEEHSINLHDEEDDE